MGIATLLHSILHVIHGEVCIEMLRAFKEGAFDYRELGWLADWYFYASQPREDYKDNALMITDFKDGFGGTVAGGEVRFGIVLLGMLRCAFKSHNPSDPSFLC